MPGTLAACIADYNVDEVVSHVLNVATTKRSQDTEFALGCAVPVYEVVDLAVKVARGCSSGCYSHTILLDVYSHDVPFRLGYSISFLCENYREKCDYTRNANVTIRATEDGVACSSDRNDVTSGVPDNAVRFVSKLVGYTSNAMINIEVYDKNAVDKDPVLSINLSGYDAEHGECRVEYSIDVRNIQFKDRLTEGGATLVDVLPSIARSVDDAFSTYVGFRIDADASKLYDVVDSLDLLSKVLVDRLPPDPAYIGDASSRVARAATWLLEVANEYVSRYSEVVLPSYVLVTLLLQQIAIQQLEPYYSDSNVQPIQLEYYEEAIGNVLEAQYAHIRTYFDIRNSVSGTKLFGDRYDVQIRIPLKPFEKPAITTSSVLSALANLVVNRVLIESVLGLESRIGPLGRVTMRD